jgi:Flp pilus assembly protein TadD
MFELVSGELGAAEAHLSHVVALNPDNLLGLNNLAWVLSTQGKPGGVALAERAIAIAPPGNATLLDTLAMALAVEKRVPEALATERKAVALDPKNNGLRLNLARIALQAGDKTLARTELERLQALGASFAMQSEVSKLAKDL